jgi:hypothetical protein
MDFGGIMGSISIVTAGCQNKFMVIVEISECLLANRF